MNARLWWRYWSPPVLYLALIFTVSSFPSLPKVPLMSTDVLHYPEYALLGFLLARAFGATISGERPLASAVISLLGSTVWGITDELHQAFVPGRVPDLADLQHDAIGAAAGCSIWLAWEFVKRRRAAARKGSGVEPA